ATGRKAFSGATQASLISAILRDEPAPISQAQPASPPALERLIRVCLAKDPEERWQSAGDVARELRWLAEGSNARSAIGVDASGGPVTTLCDAVNSRGGSWSSAGEIVFAPDIRSTIFRVPASGGVPRSVTRLDTKIHTTHRWPFFLPDGRHFLYLAVNHNA